MIRTFRLYQLRELSRITLAKSSECLRNVRLRKIAETAPPRLTRLLRDLADKLKGERVDGPISRHGHWEITLHGKWPARTVTVVPGPLPFLPIEVSIWLRRTSGWLVVFEANRSLCDAAVYLIAEALSGDVSMVTPFSLHQGHWDAIAAFLDEREGDFIGGRFYKTKAGGTDLEWVALRRSPGSDPKLLRQSFQHAEGIGELLVQTPYIDSISAGITCRIGRTGNIRIYGTEISDSMVDALLLELERVWADIPSMPKTE